MVAAMVERLVDSSVPSQAEPLVEKKAYWRVGQSAEKMVASKVVETVVGTAVR